MVDDYFVTLSLVRTATVALGVFLVALSLRAYLRSRQPSRLWLAAGLGLLTLGAIVEGVAVQLGQGLQAARLLDAAVGLAGFAVLVYSLYTK